jgi:putative ABC transport system permease protein
MLNDLRYALRMLRKDPGFTAVAVFTLALGIGATTAVFSVLDTAVLRPMPVREPERLVILRPRLRGERYVLFNPLFEDLRRRQTTLEGVFAVSDEPYLRAFFEGATAPAYVRGSLVSGSYFSLLGLAPALGRLLMDADDQILGTPGSTGCAAVVSHAFWSLKFQQDPAVLGRRVRLRETDCTIVGVAPAGFKSHEPGYAPEVWAPLRALTEPKLLENRRLAFFSGVMGRLDEGATLAQAEAELTTIYQQLVAAEPLTPRGREDKPRPPYDFSIKLLPGGHGLEAVENQFGKPLVVVLAVVGVVLLIAAVNVANLLLSRGAVRASELATRAALGASRGRLVRQLFTEGTLLAALGCVVGVTLAWLVTPALASLISLPYMPIALDTGPDHRVLLAAVAATALAALLAGILPALRLSKTNLQPGIGSAGRTTGSVSGQWLTRALVTAQLALSLMLVTAAGLLLRTVVHILSIDPGFQPERVAVLDVRHEVGGPSFGEVEASEKVRLAALYASLESRLNSLPGLRAASLSWLGLFGGSDLWLRLIDPDNPEDRRDARVDYVSPRYFETVGMQLIRGRGFTEADREGTPRVAVINEALQRQRFGGSGALGHRLALDYRGEEERPFTVVGVLRDSKYNNLRESKVEPMIWAPLAQAPFQIRSVSLRVEPGMQAGAVRDAQQVLAASDPRIMVRKVTTLSAQVAETTSRERLLLGLALGFGGLALLLAAIGLYGMVAYAVARRTPEIGVRLALGAQSGAVSFMVVGDALRLAGWGLLAGVPLSLAAGYALRAFLFGVAPYDVVALGGACLVLAAVAALAAYVPARKASQVDPVVALRYE